MIREEYIFLDVDVASKEQLLDFVSEKALKMGITDNKEGLKSDFLKREAEYSTGLQNEFAIPHAKSEYAKETAVFFVKTSPAKRFPLVSKIPNPQNIVNIKILTITIFGDEEINKVEDIKSKYPMEIVILWPDFSERIPPRKQVIR